MQASRAGEDGGYSGGVVPKGRCAFFEKGKGLSAGTAMFSEKPVVASGGFLSKDGFAIENLPEDAIKRAETEDCGRAGASIGAYMIFPLSRGGERLCLCFCRREKGEALPCRT